MTTESEDFSGIEVAADLRDMAIRMRQVYVAFRQQGFGTDEALYIMMNMIASAQGNQ